MGVLAISFLNWGMGGCIGNFISKLGHTPLECSLGLSFQDYYYLGFPILKEYWSFFTTLVLDTCPILKECQSTSYFGLSLVKEIVDVYSIFHSPFFLHALYLDVRLLVLAQCMTHDEDNTKVMFIITPYQLERRSLFPLDFRVQILAPSQIMRLHTPKIQRRFSESTICGYRETKSIYF